MNANAPRPFISPRAAASGGVKVNEGQGPKIATDLVGDQEYQAVKIALGGPGVASLLEPGQQPAALSIPVVLANDAVINVPPGGATEATLGLVAKEATTAKDATLATRASESTLVAVGNAVATLGTQTTLAAVATEIGPTNETPAATDSAVSGLNGLIKRLLASTTAMIAAISGMGAPATSTATLSNVPASVANVTLLAANALRKGATIYNDSAAELLVKFGATASAASFTVDMLPGAYLEVPYGYTGRIDGIWASATGTARMTEFTV